MLAGIVEERIERSENVAGRARQLRVDARNLDKAFEDVSKLPNALEVMAQCMGFRSGPDDDDVAGIHAALETLVKQGAVDVAPQAQRNRQPAQS